LKIKINLLVGACQLFIMKNLIEKDENVFSPRIISFNIKQTFSNVFSF